MPDGQFSPVAHDSRRTHLSFFHCPKGGAVQRMCVSEAIIASTRLIGLEAKARAAAGCSSVR